VTAGETAFLTEGLPMIVWIVEAGHYDDCHVVGVFRNPYDAELAALHADEDEGGTFTEYDVDEIRPAPIEGDICWQVEIFDLNGEITKIEAKRNSIKFPPYNRDYVKNWTVRRACGAGLMVCRHYVMAGFNDKDGAVKISLDRRSTGMRAE
jgi:hypothetical protein